MSAFLCGFKIAGVEKGEREREEGKNEEDFWVLKGLQITNIINTMKNPIHIKHRKKSMRPGGEILEITSFLLTVNFSAWLHDDRAIKFYGLISFFGIHSILVEWESENWEKGMKGSEVVG